MKNKTQRITALFLIMVMVLNFGSFADAATPQTVLDVLEIKEVPPIVEEEVSVPVTIAPNSEMTSFSISIAYDKDSLEYLGASRGAVIAEAGGDFEGDVGKTSNTVSGKFPEKITGGGELFVLKFKLKSGSTAETPRLTKSAKISLSKVTLNSDSSKITVSVDPGSIATAKPILLESIALDPAEASIFVGDSFGLGYSYSPENTTVDTAVSFKSANDGIASVDANGNVTGISAGETKIIATSGNKKASTKIIVNPVPIDSVTLNKDSGIFAIGDRKQVEPICEPAGAVIDSISWESEDRDIAKVSDTGLVTASTPGETSIIATVTSGNETFIESFSAIIPDGLVLNKESGTLSPGGSEQLEASFVSASIPDLPTPAITWESSNPESASVDENGLVTAGVSGEASITATSVEGNFKASYQVTVFPDLILNETSGSLLKDETMELKAAYAPGKLKNSAEPSISWSSSDFEIASVDNGLVTAKSFGDATITAHDSIGNVSAEFSLKVEMPLEKITLDKNSGTLAAGATESLAVAYFPETTNVDRTVKWTSSDISIATVNAGIVTGVSSGKAKITATVGKASATYEVMVTSPEGAMGNAKARSRVLFRATPSISLRTEALGGSSTTQGVLINGGNARLIVTYNQVENMTESITWKSGDLDTVSVTQEGVVTAKKIGRTLITAETSGLKATYEIFVPNGFTVEDPQKNTKSSIDIGSGKTLDLTAKYVTSATDFPTPLSVEWSANGSDDVAKVSSDGKVTAIGRGKAAITATLKNGFVATYNVDVEIPPASFILENAKLETSNHILAIETSETLKVTPNPSNASHTITTDWKSDSPNIASVDNSGKITAVASGKATITADITATSSDGSRTTKAKLLYVIHVASEIKLNKIDGRINLYGKPNTEKLEVSYLPVGLPTVAYPTLTWESTNPDIASVSSEGLITALKIGSTNITVTSNLSSEPSFKKEYKVIVFAPLTSINLKNTNDTNLATNTKAIVLPLNKNATLDVIYNPEDTSDSKDVIISEEPDKKIATATVTNLPNNNNKKIINLVAKGTGNTKIEVNGANGTPAKYDIYVSGEIRINGPSEEWSFGDEKQLTAQYTLESIPTEMNHPTAIWSSDKITVARVDNKGLVTAVGLGEATITANVEGIIGTYKINVTAPLKTIEIVGDIPLSADLPTTSKHVLPIHEKTELSIKYNPENTTSNKRVEWTVNKQLINENSNILRGTPVDIPATSTDINTKAKVELTAVAGGMATIEATSELNSNPKIKSSYEIYVPTGIAMKNNKGSGTLTLSEGKEEKLEAMYLPKVNGAPEPTVKWSSSDTEVAEIDENTGVVKPVSLGKIIITAVSKIGDFEKEYKLEVIEPLTDIEIFAESDSFLHVSPPEKTYHLLALDALAELSVKYTPELTSDDKTIQWTSSNENITILGPATPTDSATGTDLSSNTRIKAAKSGKTKLTAILASTATNPKKIKADYEIYVPDGLIITGLRGDLALEATKQLSARFSPMSIPIDATPKITWESSNDSIAKVDDKGLVTASSYGDVIIRASTEVGETPFSKDYPISVTEPLKGIEISSDKLDKANPLLPIGHSAELTVTHTPEITTDDKSKIEWKSSNDAIATVSPQTVATNTDLAVKANVQGVSGGKVTITAIAHSTGLPARVYATYDVYVPSGLALNKNFGILTLGAKNTEQLTAGFIPTIKGFPTPLEVTWKSQNPKIASVDDKGLVTAEGLGKTSIIASTIVDNKTYTAIYDVDVAVPMTGIALDKTAGTLSANPNAEATDLFTTEQLTVLYTPEDTTDPRDITWKSSDARIASVGTNGLVTAISPGKATITATVGKFKATYEATVVMPLTNISLNKSSGILTMVGNTTEQLFVNYNPLNAGTDQTVTWSTSDPTIATVADGLVTAVATGNASITASVGKLTATYQLTVTSPLSKIELNKESGTLGLGASETLSLSYSPENTTDPKTVIWTSANEEIATVNPRGVITGVGLGDTSITATVDSLKTSYELTVNIPLTAIDMNTLTGNLVIGRANTEQLSVSFNPENTTDPKGITWSSSAPTIAEVSSRGLVTGIATGTATITASVGAHTTDYIATVTHPLTGIALDKSSGSLVLGSDVISEQLNLIFTPEGSQAGKNISWLSSDPAVATISGTGLISAVAPGKTTITVTVENFSATYDLTVKPEGSSATPEETTKPPAGENTTTPPAAGNTTTPAAGENATTPPAAENATTPAAGENSAENKDGTTDKTSQNISLTVKVLDADGKTAMPGLKIELRSDPQYATSDANGFFTFSSVPLGKHTLTVSDASDKQLASREINVVTGTENKANNETGEIMIKEGTSEVTITITIKDGKIILNGDVTEGNLTPAKASLFSSSVNPKTGQEMATASIISLALIALMLAIVLFVNKRARS